MNGAKRIDEDTQLPRGTRKLELISTAECSCRSAVPARHQLINRFRRILAILGQNVADHNQALTQLDDRYRGNPYCIR